ncbi:MAG: MFS transporter [Candidatus Dormibacteraceae bacterium]
MLLVLCQSVQSLTFGGIALFLPLIRRDVAINYTQAGTLAGVSIAVYAAMQIPSGYLADRFGAKRLFVLGLVGVSVTAFSLAQLHQFWMILLNQAASGLFRALVFAPGLLLITSLFSPARRATAMGVYVAGGFSSNVFLNAIGPLAVGWTGWRGMFLIFSTVGLLVLMLYYYLGSEGPLGLGTSKRPIAGLLAVLRQRSMWVLGAIQYVRLAVVSGLAFWLPTFLVVDKGQSLQVAGLAVALAAALGAPANILGGYISDRLRNPGLVIAVSLVVLTATNLMLLPVHDRVLLFAVVAANGVFAQFYFGPLFSMPIDIFGSRVAGLTTGIGNLFANLGGLTAAVILGAVKDLTGSFSAGLYLLAGLCMAGLVCVRLLGWVSTRDRGALLALAEQLNMEFELPWI